MNWYSVFYWISVADSVKDTLNLFGNWLIFLSIIMLVAYIIGVMGKATAISSARTSRYIEHKEIAVDPNLDSDVMSWEYFRSIIKKFLWPFIIIMLICKVSAAFCPSKKDSLVIVTGGAVGNFITSDSSAKVIPSEAMTLLRDAIREKIKEINTPEGIKKVEDMTKEELLEYIKKPK